MQLKHYSLFQATHEYVVIINEICCNRNMSFSYHLLGTLKNTISSLFASVWGYVTEFQPIEHWVKAIISCLDLAARTACLILHTVLSLIGQLDGKHSLEALKHKQNHNGEGFRIPALQHEPLALQSPLTTSGNIANNVPNVFKIPKLYQNVERL